MARRRTAKNKTTRRRNTISISNTAQSLIIGNAFVKGATNANLYQFFTGRVDSGTALGTYYNPTTKDDIITLPELLGIDRSRQQITTTAGQSYNLGPMTATPGLQLEKMKSNIQANAFNMVGTAIVVPIAFKLGKKVLSKSGVTRSANKVFKMVGLSEVKV